MTNSLTTLAKAAGSVATPAAPVHLPPKFRIITDEGVEMVVEVNDCSIQFNYNSLTGHRVSLAGRLLSHNNLPVLYRSEPERIITVPDEPSS